MSYEKIVGDIAGQITNCEKYKLISDKTPGIHVGFHRKGKCVDEINKGLEDINGKKEIDKHSIFHLASMNKIVIYHYLTQTQPFIGNKKVSSFLKCNIPELTVRHLFVHQSGLPQIDIITPEEFNSISLSDMATLLLSKNPVFKPGTRASYCNSNYVVLSEIVEKISGRPHEEVIHEYYNKKSITFYSNLFHDVHHATAYWHTKKNRFKSPPAKRVDIGWGDGALLASPHEYLKFWQIIKHDQFGFSINTKYGKVYWTGGLTFVGCESMLCHFKDWNLTVILAVNFLCEKEELFSMFLWRLLSPEDDKFVMTFFEDEKGIPVPNWFYV